MKEVTIYNDYNSSFSYYQEKIEELILNIFSEKHFKNIKLSVIFTKKEFLSKMKNKYFNVNQYTDVIAFNINDNKDDIDGEIYISIDDVKENAELFSESFNDEFKRVLIHGVLHLIGYEDSSKEEKIIMTNLEDKYLSEYNFKVIE